MDDNTTDGATSRGDNLVAEGDGCPACGERDADGSSSIPRRRSTSTARRAGTAMSWGSGRVGGGVSSTEGDEEELRRGALRGGEAGDSEGGGEVVSGRRRSGTACR